MGGSQLQADPTLGAAMPPLILEPARWGRPALLELENSLHGGLSGILGTFRAGEVFANGFLPTPDPLHLETALNLLQAVVELHDETKQPALSDSGIVKLVNLEYQTLLTVMSLVPGRSIEEQNRRRKAKAGASNPTPGA